MQAFQLSWVDKYSLSDTILIVTSSLKGTIMYTIFKEEGYPVAHLDTFLSMIEGCIGSQQYLRLFVHKNEGQAHDVIENGRFACAYFASSILTLTTLITQGIHTTVFETIEDMVRSKWYQIDHLTKGAVIIWGPKLASDGNQHKHIGFYMGDETAISTDGVTGIPTKHHFTYGVESGIPLRTIEAIFFHKKLRS